MKKLIVEWEGLPEYQRLKIDQTLLGEVKKDIDDPKCWQAVIWTQKGNIRRRKFSTAKLAKAWVEQLIGTLPDTTQELERQVVALENCVKCCVDRPGSFHNRLPKLCTEILCPLSECFSYAEEEGPTP